MEILKRREQRRPPIPGPVPWLIFPNGKGWKKQMFYTIPSLSSSSLSHTNYIHKSIPELSGKRIWACYHGWLLLFDCRNDDGDDLLFLWNPISFETIKLPPLHLRPKQRICAIVFTSSPSNPGGCTIVLFVWGRPIIKYCQPGDRRWTQHEYGIKLKRVFEAEKYKDVILIRVVCLDGAIYAFTHRGHMVAIHIDDRKLINMKSLGIQYPKPQQFARYFSSYFLESYGELLAVVMVFQSINSKDVIIGIEVFKLDFSEMIWLPVKTLKDIALFLGDDCCTSCLATESGIEGNQIHFTLENDKNLYTFNLEEGSLLISVPCPRLLTPWYPPTWVKPNFRLTNIQVEGNSRIGREEQKEEEEEDEEKREVERIRQWSDHNYLDIFTAIAEHLRICDYMHFRAACRLFRLAAPPIRWRISRSITLEMQFSSPLLVIIPRNDKGIICKFIDPKHHDTYFLSIPELLGGTLIRCSKDGYLLLAADFDFLFFFNPFTRMLLKFPKLPWLLHGFTFSSLPTSPDCLAVGMCWHPGGLIIASIRFGEDEWSLGLFENNIAFFPKPSSPIFYNEVFYILGEKGNLGVINIINGDETGCSWEVLAKPEVPCNEFRHSFLAECNGELMSVFVCRLGSWVKVFRLDHAQMVWVKVENLGNYMLFVSDSSSFSAVARSPGMENKIYFPRLFGQGIVYYSLETGKFHTHGSNNSMDNFCNMREQLYCGWIEPTGVLG